MPEPPAIGLVEQTLIEAMVSVGARPDRPFVRSTKILDASRDAGVSPRYAFAALVDLGAWWTVSVPLVQHHGNFGSPDFEAANPKYTETRLTEIGHLIANGSEPLTRIVALINGDLHADGTNPPFSPAHILDAVSFASTDPRCSDDELVGIVGPPISPTGSIAVGDLAALRAGDLARVRFESTISFPRPSSVVITDLPPGVGARDVMTVLMERSRVRRIPTYLLDDPEAAEHFRQTVVLPIVDIDDRGFGRHSEIHMVVRRDIDSNELRQQLLDVWPVAVERAVELPRPLAALIRRCASAPEREVADAVAVIRANDGR